MKTIVKNLLPNQLKIIFLMFIYFLFTYSVTYAQNIETYKLDKIVPMNPEGAKFANYFFTPPISATGSIPIDIPLYELNVDGVKIPITLSYQTTGIKVTELSGSVGLGWSLNVGGGVYRSINGLPDDNQSNNPSTSTFLDPTITINDYMQNQVTLQGSFQAINPIQTVLASMSSNSAYDINQDNYSYNFLNNTGRLFFNNQLQLKQVNENNLIFSHDSKYLNNFTAIDDLGNTYKFGTKENTRNTYYSSSSSNTSMSGSVYGATAWKLSEITTVRDQKINFSYVDYATSYSFPSSNSIYHIPKSLDETFEQQSFSCFFETTRFSTSYSNLQNNNKLIASVTSDDASVVFIYSDNTNASNWKKKLDRIEVRNQNGSMIKKIRFEYSLFNGDARLKLTKIIFDSLDNSEPSVHTFLYNEQKNIPPVNTMGKDIFGFYNGYDNNTTLLKTEPLYQHIPESYYNSNREVVDAFASAGTLRQITYPTSGGLKLYYGLNRSNNNYAPGLRVEKLEFLDMDGVVVNTKLYDYSDLVGLSVAFPDYPERIIPVDPNLNISFQSFSYSSEDTKQQRHLPANFFYKNVIIKEIGNGEELKTIEHYDEPTLYQTNEPLEGYVFQPILTNREFYKGNQVIKSETSNYNQIVSQTEFVNILEAHPSYYLNAFFSDLTYPCYSYSPGLFVKQVIRAKKLNLLSQNENYFFDDGSSNFSNTTYHYDNPNHSYATRIVSNSSDGADVIKKIKYTDDMVNSGLDQLGIYAAMKAKNIINVPIVVSTEKNNKKQETVTNYFQPWPNLFMPQMIKSLNTTTGLHEVRVNFNSYDNKGNILEQQKTNGIKEAYLWGYKGKYPVAKVIGSDYLAISTLVNQSVLDNGSSVQIEAQLSSLRIHFSTNPNIMLETYTYEPLVGMTSQTDAKGLTTYYEYDSFQRLKHVKDQNGNIVKSYCYNYAGQITDCGGGSATVRPTFSLNYSFQTQGYREFQIAVTDTVSGLTEYYYVNSNSSGTLSDIPGGTGSISINELNYVGTYNFYVDSSSQNGVYVVFSPMTMGGNMNLYISEQ